MGDVLKLVDQASLSGVTMTVGISPYKFQHRREEPPVQVPNLGLSGILNNRFDDPEYYDA